MPDPSIVGIGKFPLFDISCNHYFIKNIDLTALAQEILIDADIEKRLSNDKTLQGSCYEDTIFTGGVETAKLKNCISSIADSIGMVISGGIWSQVHHQYESTNIHSHADGSDKAFVFYVKVPEGAGSLYFEVEPFGTSVVQPIEGLLVVFPSCIKHGVYKNLSSEIRISIAGNLKNK